MRSRVTALLLVLVAPVAAHAQDALVVTPDALRPGLAEWLAHRRGQGLEVAVAAPGDDVAATIRAAHARSEGRLRHVLLLGDVGDVPCAYRDAVAIAPWEEDDRIASDAPYADVDGDEVPDLALGRVPALTPDEARALLGRSLAYETRPPAGAWRRRLALVAGVGGFGVQQDMALEMLTRIVLNQDVPAGVETRFTYAKETSPFCVPPPELQDELLGCLNAGALAVAYVGHGSARHVDRMTWDGRRWPILELDAASRIDCGNGAPLLLFVACSTGQYDAQDDCLAEAALRRPAGPAAVIASSRVSTPYGNGHLAIELLHRLYDGNLATVGEILLAAKRSVVTGEDASASRRTVEAMSASFYEPDAGKRARDRQEHVWLYQLFGDPLLRLARPAEATLHPPAELVCGTTAEVALRSPVGGRATLELVPRRDAFAQPRRPGRTVEEMREDHARANAGPLATATADVEAGSVAVLRLAVPESLPATRHVLRLSVEGADGHAVAGVAVHVRAGR